MTSQDYELVSGMDLQIGDVLIGCNKTRWSHDYEVIEKTHSLYTLKEVVAGINYPYSRSDAKLWVKRQYIKYDPNQQGDLEDDI